MVAILLNRKTGKIKHFKFYAIRLFPITNCIELRTNNTDVEFFDLENEWKWLSLYEG